MSVGVQAGELYKCDRSAKAHADGKTPEEFVPAGGKIQGAWQRIEWTDNNGVTNAYTLCPACCEKYSSIRKTWNRDMSEFINEGY